MTVEEALAREGWKMEFDPILCALCKAEWYCPEAEVRERVQASPHFCDKGGCPYRKPPRNYRPPPDQPLPPEM